MNIIRDDTHQNQKLYSARLHFLRPSTHAKGYQSINVYIYRTISNKITYSPNFVPHDLCSDGSPFCMEFRSIFVYLNFVKRIVAFAHQIKCIQGMQTPTRKLFSNRVHLTHTRNAHSESNY